MRLRFLLPALLGLGACVMSTSVAYTPRGTIALSPKPATCQLEVLSVVPRRPYDEVGTFDVDNQGVDWVRTADDLLARTRARACAAGADALLTIKAGPAYTQAIALHWQTTEPAAPIPAATPLAPTEPATK